MTFAPADHVTEREVGPWRDCTFAAMLETLRLGLPDGAAIPATEAEKERFRATAGLPDNHKGATIEDTIPGAKRLYGLRPDQYELTRAWSTAERWLGDPGRVLVVTGSMGAVPIHLRRWSPAFMGAHAVAGRGATVPIWCDPLAPKGAYAGEPVTVATWKAFATSLAGWQAFAMEAYQESVQITDPTPMRVDLPSGRQLYATDGTTPLVRVSPATTDTYSPAGGPKALQRYVVITTGGIRQLAVVRTSGLVFEPYCPSLAPGDVQHSVTVQIDGAETFRTTV